MNDQHHNAYLDAIGIDRYVSRFQLPGAAVTPRPRPVENVAAEPAEPAPTMSELPAVLPARAGRAAKSPVQPVQMPAAIAGAGSVPRFSLTTIVAGNWLWVEELPAIPLAREQVQLVQAMALAMGRVSAIEASNARSNTPDIAQFDWPMHTNEQLDLGEDAAAAALTSFLRRRLDSGDLALVLLGQGAANRVPLGQLSCKHLVLGHTSADLISRPELKKQAWAELKSFLGSC